MATAAKPGAPQVHDVAPNNTVFNWHIGDKAATDAAFAAAAHVTRLDLVNNRLIPNAIEPRAAVGEYDSGSDTITLYTTSQNPHVARLVLSAFIGIAPEHKLRVIAPDVGGGFGSKIFIYAEETVCAWAAKKIDRPVKWTADRTEAFLSDAHGRDHVTHAELALDANGKITGLRVHTIANLGAYLSTFCVVGADLSLRPSCCRANTTSPPSTPRSTRSTPTPRRSTPIAARDGRRRPSSSSVSSRSRRARPAAIPRSSAAPISSRPSRTRRRSSCATTPAITRAALDKALELADYNGVAARKAASAAKGKLRGIGISAYIEACGLAPSAAVGSLGAGVGLWESAEVRVNPIGTVEVLTGSHSHGQGHETTFAQLVSERLGIPIENVSIVHGDTDKVQMGMGTYGSRSGAVGMSAISKALDKIEAKAKKVAGHVLEASESDIEFKDGKFTVKGTDKSIDFGSVALAGLYRAQVQRPGAGARPEGDGVLGSDQFHLPGRRAHLRARDRSARPAT